MTDDEMFTTVAEVFEDFGIPALEDGPDPLKDITIGEVIRRWRDNCWDDHHEGGEHREDLKKAREIMIRFGFDLSDIDTEDQINALPDHSEWN